MDINSVIRRVWVIAGILTVYVLAAKVGLAFAFLNESASAVWPPTGIALGALLVFGLRIWPAIFAGAFLANVTTAGTVLTSFGIATGNTLEAVLGAYWVMRFAGGDACFERARGVFRFTILAALLATMASATFGVTSLALGGFASWNDFGAIWLTWWLGDVAGALLVTPFVVLWCRTPRTPIARDRAAELVIMYLASFGTAALVFGGAAGSGNPIAFVCLPAIAWAAFRFGPREVATAILVMSVIAISGTLAGFGPFFVRTPNESLLLLQAFMGTTALMMLAIAALVGEHRGTLAELEAANRVKGEFLDMASQDLRDPVAQDLLEVTHLLGGDFKLARRPMELDTTVREMLAARADTGRARVHTLDIWTERTWVDADPERIAQALSRMLDHAFRSTPPGGRIEVAVHNEGTEALVAVKWEAGSEPRKGIPRMSLALARLLIEHHGGRTTGFDAAGEGGALGIRLPVVAEPAVEPSIRTAAAEG